MMILMISMSMDRSLISMELVGPFGSACDFVLTWQVDSELTGGKMTIQTLLSTSLQVAGQESAKSTLFKPIPYKLLTRDTEKAGGMSRPLNQRAALMANELWPSLSLSLSQSRCC